MNVIIFGATGMVGQGVLRECLLDPDIARVVTIGRNPTGENNPKLHEIVQADLFNYSTIEDQLTGLDACFFCLGVASTGMTEENYRHIIYDLTLAAAQTLVKLNPQMTFIFISGQGTDSTAKGRIMWARVKGATENALLALPFKAAYMFRPGVIQPLHGIRSRTQLYRVMYTLLGPVLPAVRALFPNVVTTTEKLGRAMIQVAKHGYSKPILEMRDINAI